LKPFAALITTCLLLLPAAARADTLVLANKGKVVGTIRSVTIKIGPLKKTLARADIASIRLRKRRCEIQDKDGTNYVGRLKAVKIKSVAGVLSFGGKSIRSLTLETEDSGPWEDETPVPVVERKPKDAGALENVAADDAKEEKDRPERIKELLKRAAALRDAYAKQADELAEAERAALKEQYAEEWAKAVRRVAEILEKHPNGTPPAEVLTDLEAAEAAKTKLQRDIRAAKAAMLARAKRRRARIRACHRALARYLLTGKRIREEAMKKVYEGALNPGK